MTDIPLDNPDDSPDEAARQNFSAGFELELDEDEEPPVTKSDRMTWDPSKIELIDDSSTSTS